MTQLLGHLTVKYILFCYVQILVLNDIHFIRCMHIEMSIKVKLDVFEVLYKNFNHNISCTFYILGDIYKSFYKKPYTKHKG